MESVLVDKSMIKSSVSEIVNARPYTYHLVNASWIRQANGRNANYGSQTKITCIGCQRVTQNMMESESDVI